MSVSTRFQRFAALAAPIAALVVIGTATPALAASVSTTGASGRTAAAGGTTYRFYATDTLSDGHCAQWQQQSGGAGSWRYIGAQACSGSEELVSSRSVVRDGTRYRICRTGVGNCSSSFTL
jgi:hypothetical protein